MMHRYSVQFHLLSYGFAFIFCQILFQRKKVNKRCIKNINKSGVFDYISPRC